MRYVKIPGTDLDSSVICLGALPFGADADRKTSFEQMDFYTFQGGNFIDTANVYSNWLPVEKSISEKIIGAWMKEKKNRNEIILGTKGAHPDLNTRDVPRLSSVEIRSDLEESLASLQTDHIDLYWLHRDDEGRPVEDILDTMNKLVGEGKIRYFGCSNWKAYRIWQAIRTSASSGSNCFVGDQMLWSLAVPNQDGFSDKTLVMMDEELLQLHKETGMAAIPYSSQANGFFTKLEKAGSAPLADSIEKKYKSKENMGIFRRIKKLKEELGVSVGEIAISYLCSQPFTTIPIIGSRTVEQLKEGLKASELVLDANMLDFLKNGE